MILPPKDQFPARAIQQAATKLAVDSVGRGVPVLRTEFLPGGGVNHSWHFEGKECRKAVLPLKGVAKQYAGFCLILEDLDEAKAWIQRAHSAVSAKYQGPSVPEDRLMGELDPEIAMLAKPLTFAAITAYGKCFASTEGRGIKLEVRDHVPAHMVAKHGDVIEYRNQLTAHAGAHKNKHLEYAQPVIVYPPTGHAGVPLARCEMTRIQYVDDRSDEVSFLDLIEGVSAIVRRKVLDLAERLQREARNP